MRRRLSVLLAAVLALVPVCAGAPARAQNRAAADHVAIVVNAATPVRALTMDQLRRIFLAEQQFWSDGTRITLLVRAPVADERNVALRLIYRMDESQFRQYWVGKMFRSEVASGPQLVYSSRMARELVSVIPGAITFMPASEVGTLERVLRIDGKLPGDAGYPL